MKANIIFLTDSEKLLFVTSTRQTPFFHVGHELYSSELTTELFSRCTTKFMLSPLQSLLAPLMSLGEFWTQH